ncbi:MAG: serine--tRNA ligase, partial [Alphaproteobacteria bacterium]|nr:serine--tRNA ligase [Alphaproteobacteria bacterium]
MHDIKYIRDNPAAFDAALAKRNLKPVSGDLLALDSAWRGAQRQLEENLAARNEGSQIVARLKKEGQKADAEMARLQTLKAALPALEEAANAARAKLDVALAMVPNLPDASVPEGKDEKDNVVLRHHGKPRDFSYSPKSHDLLGEALGLMDFETAASMAGARFVFLRGQLARLERALQQFMLDTNSNLFGYEETSPPLLVRGDTVFGTGQLPKFA